MQTVTILCSRLKEIEAAEEIVLIVVEAEIFTTILAEEVITMLEIIQVEMQVLQVVLIINTILHQVSPTIKDLHAKSVVRMVMQPWIVTTVWTTHTKANNLLLSLLRWLLHQTHSTQINPIGSLTHEQPITLLLICQPYLIIKSILALILLLLVMVKQFLPLI